MYPSHTLSADPVNLLQLESFKRNGVFYLAAQPEHIDQLYSWFGDIITHVWAEDGLLVQCLSNENCVASPTNPKGMSVSGWTFRHL